MLKFHISNFLLSQSHFIILDVMYLQVMYLVSAILSLYHNVNMTTSEKNENSLAFQVYFA